MKGNIQKRGDSHRISVELTRGEDGKRRSYYETVPTTRRRDAELRLAELITDINNQRFVEPSSMLLSGYVRQWGMGLRYRQRPSQDSRGLHRRRRTAPHS